MHCEDAVQECKETRQVYNAMQGCKEASCPGSIKLVGPANVDFWEVLGGSFRDFGRAAEALGKSRLSLVNLSRAAQSGGPVMQS